MGARLHATVLLRNLRGALLLILGLGVAPSSLSHALTTPPPNTTVDGQHEVLSGTVSPRIAKALDGGRASGSTWLSGVTIELAQSPSKSTALLALLSAQQDTASPAYHHWLTPQQYGYLFGADAGATEQVREWLVTQGFSGITLNNSHTALSFNGTVAQIDAAFSTEIHSYREGNRSIMANAAEMQIPYALRGVILGVNNVAQFQPLPHSTRRSASLTVPFWTTSQSQHFVTPADLETIYNISPLYANGYTGRDQRIAVVGQSLIDLADPAHFRSAVGLPARAPTLVLVPGTGTSVTSSGDESESDIDVEYAGAVAPDANILLVYTGDNKSYGVFDALIYSVDNNLAPVITISYGECESDLSQSEVATIERTLMQATSQGQTVVASSGDSGATGCDVPDPQPPAIATQGLAVDYPASSQYVTAVGGTEFNDDGSSSYWSSSTGSNGGSALSYIPEWAWDETNTDENNNTLLGSGGGASSLTLKPSWQTGLGVPPDGSRDVPDLAVEAAVYHDGYIYCSTDPASLVPTSCANGLLDSTGDTLTIAGGTSFGAPIVAALIAITNQESNTGGQGSVNARLYTLHASHPEIFHDIVVGDNKQPCQAATKDCPLGGSIGYDAGPGYDQVTGLGSPDAYALVTNLATQSLDAAYTTTLTLTPEPLVTTLGSSATIVASLTSPSGLPNGVLRFSVEGAGDVSIVPVYGGQASYVFSPTVAGEYQVNVSYAGNDDYAAASASTTIEVTASTDNGMGQPRGFSLESKPGELGSIGGTALLSVIPQNGYGGQVAFNVTSEDSTLVNDGCFVVRNATVVNANVATTTLTIGRSVAECRKIAASQGQPVQPVTAYHVSSRREENALIYHNVRLAHHRGEVNRRYVECAMLCLLAGFRRKRQMRVVCLLIGFSGALLFSGCGVTSTASEAPAAQYTVEVTGTDTVNAAIHSSVITTVWVE